MSSIFFCYLTTFSLSWSGWHVDHTWFMSGSKCVCVGHSLSVFSFILYCWIRNQDIRRPAAPTCCPPTASSLFPNQIECSCFSIMFTAFISSFSISCSYPFCYVQLPGKQSCFRSNWPDLYHTEMEAYKQVQVAYIYHWFQDRFWILCNFDQEKAGTEDEWDIFTQVWIYYIINNI